MLAVFCDLTGPQNRILDGNFKQLQDRHRYKASVYSNKSISMESFILLSLSPFISLLIFCAFRDGSVLIFRTRDRVTNELIVREESALEKNVSKRSRPIRIFIPKVLARWPWPRQINPHYAVVKKEADAWLTSFQPFSPKAQDAFDRCDFSKCSP